MLRCSSNSRRSTRVVLAHGGTRIFRFAYYDPIYVRMAQASLPLWRDSKTTPVSRCSTSPVPSITATRRRSAPLPTPWRPARRSSATPRRPPNAGRRCDSTAARCSTTAGAAEPVRPSPLCSVAAWSTAPTCASRRRPRCGSSMTPSRSRPPQTRGQRAVAAGHRRPSPAYALADAAAHWRLVVALGHAPRGPVGERASQLRQRVAVREPVRDGLVDADRLAELLTRLRVLDRRARARAATCRPLRARARRTRACVSGRTRPRRRSPRRRGRRRAGRGAASNPSSPASRPQPAPRRACRRARRARGRRARGRGRASRRARPTSASRLQTTCALQLGRQLRQRERDGREVRPRIERAAELLEQHRLLEEAEPGAPCLLRHRHADPAELRELLPRRRLPAHVGVGELGDALRGIAVGEERRAPRGAAAPARRRRRSPLSATSAGRARARR